VDNSIDKIMFSWYNHMIKKRTENIYNIYENYLKNSHYLRGEQIKILEEIMKQIEATRLTEIRKSIKS